MPTIQDAQLNVKGVLINGKDVYATDGSSFARLWLDLLAISASLNKLLGARYRSHLSQLSLPQIVALRTELAPEFEVTEMSTSANLALNVAVHQLHLHQRAAQIGLFRPDKDTLAINKVQEAAEAINVILEKSMADGTALHTAPSTISLIVPAMVTHLNMAKSKVQLISQLGAHRLDLCLMFLKTLENNYPAAGIIRRLFLAVNETKEKKDKASTMAGFLQEPSHHYSPSAAEISNAETPHSSIGSSEFALLPMQGPLGVLGETDPYVL